ncbi:MAG: PIN domain-containing protein [Candidatus Pseudobacter hemicellulosilyticus]|uniref:PIN domain-containing protein n=1 Tax=Candidatus Pseudobacter hemicellulosilyticus TaxID=3121375 RepID=A0AAJ5WVT1_9BACT|nr:MAG: PIN domain-containing protein [Pseudobacter sp.]
MKETYPGYYKKTPQEIKKVWDNGLLTFDSNVLLNIYRYPADTRKELLKLIDKLSAKIFLTHQGGLEFHRNRFDVIVEQEKTYREFNENFSRIETELSARNCHPYLSDIVHHKLSQVLGEVKTEIRSNEQYFSDLITNDEIYLEINRLFEKKIESPFTPEELHKLLEDEKKKQHTRSLFAMDENSSEERKYSDLLLWKQIIHKAKKTRKPIILVTDEGKKNWWWTLNNGHIIGPRQDLVEELFNETHVDFYIYTTEKFLEYGLTYLQEKGNAKVIDEVKERKEDFMKATA